MADANVPQIVTESGSSSATGERFIPARACYYPPAVDLQDLLRVNFDCREVRYGALYLFEEVVDGKVVWMGCRRFDRRPDGIRIDVNGNGDWRDFSDYASGYAAEHWRIVGEVKEVYKPSLMKCARELAREVSHG